MAAKLKESVIHWKKKLERNSDEKTLLNVIHKLSKVPMTLEILQETHIGKCIRNLSKRKDDAGEKAEALVIQWRVDFAKNLQNSADKSKLKSKENKESSSKSSSKHSVSHEKIILVHQEKEASHYESKKVSLQRPYSDLKKHINGNCSANSSDESSPSLYTYEKNKASPSKYISYDPHTDISEGYNPECPDLFPSKYKKKVESSQRETVDTYEPSLKRKFKEEQTEKKDYKKLKSESRSTNCDSVYSAESKLGKQEKHSFHKNKSKDHNIHEVGSDSRKLKKESGEKLKDNIKNKLSDSNKSKHKESNKNKAKSSKSKSQKLKINCSEEFTSSEVRFEDCLNFNDIVIKKKKTSKPTHSVEKKAVSTTHNKNKSSNAHSSGHQKESSSEWKDMLIVPKPKELPKLEEVDISSTLPPTMPNYRPLPRPDMFSKKKEVLSNEEAILFMSSKREKTAVYSGRRSYYTEVPSLFDLCTRILIENIDAIEYMGEVPYILLKPVLEKCTPTQLYSIENYNPHLLDDTHELWEIHCKRDYKLLNLQENETYRELYLRAFEERERKLKSITANISASMSKSNPVRQVKLAYVDSIAKPPRDVARRQAKNGTALPVNHPVKAGPPSKATPRPIAPVVNSTASSSASTSYVPKKPKVAPLMAKTLKSMRQCFRRK